MTRRPGDWSILDLHLLYLHCQHRSAAVQILRRQFSSPPTLLLYHRLQQRLHILQLRRMIMRQSRTTTSIYKHVHALSFQRLSLMGPPQYLRDLLWFSHHALHRLQLRYRPSFPLSVEVRSMSLVDLHPVSEIGSLRPHSKHTIGPMQEEEKKSSGI